MSQIDPKRDKQDAAAQSGVGEPALSPDEAISFGEEPTATDEWIRQSYSKLHRIAAVQMLRESKAHTLSATSLVNEVYLRLKASQADPKASEWVSERQFLAAAAIEMRRILIDAARKKKSLKRGGNMAKQAFEDGQLSDEAVADRVIELGEAVDALEKIQPAKAELVRLRYFLGLTESEAAKTLGISRATAARHWNFARAWLLDYLTAE